MDRTQNLIRDYGLTLLLVGASVLLFWKTMLPQIQRNRHLDRAFTEHLRQRYDVENDVRKLQTLQAADWDPLVVERMAREIFEDLGLEDQEVLVLRPQES